MPRKNTQKILLANKTQTDVLVGSSISLSLSVLAVFFTYGMLVLSIASNTLQPRPSAVPTAAEPDFGVYIKFKDLGKSLSEEWNALKKSKSKFILIQQDLTEYEKIKNTKKNQFEIKKSQILGSIAKSRRAKDIKKLSSDILGGEYQNLSWGIELQNVTYKEALKIFGTRSDLEIHRIKPLFEQVEESIPLIHADDIWERNAVGQLCQGNACLNGEGRVIAVIDGGVDYRHQDLGGCFGPACKVMGGHDFVRCEAFDVNTGRCNSPKNEDADPMDERSHGTHVAGIISANGAVLGVAPQSRILALRVSNRQGQSLDSWTRSALNRAADPNSDGRFDDSADVVNLSLGGFGNPDDDASQEVNNAVNQRGMVVVVSAGNYGPTSQENNCRHSPNDPNAKGGDGTRNSICSPGTAEFAITVGATYDRDYNQNQWPWVLPDLDQNRIAHVDWVAGFSSRGPVIWRDANGIIRQIQKPDVAAPGLEICSTKWSGFGDARLDCHNTTVHTLKRGTSMAAPMVSGVALLLRQAHPDWTPAQVKAAIMNNTIDINNISGRIQDVNMRGSGRVDANLASQLGQVPQPIFVRGDTNGDLEIDIADPVFTLLHLFAGGVSPQCLKSLDTDDDGQILINDPVLLLEFLFLKGKPPAGPYPEFGTDQTEDILTCDNPPRQEQVGGGGGSITVSQEVTAQDCESVKQLEEFIDLSVYTPMCDTVEPIQGPTPTPTPTPTPLSSYYPSPAP